MGYIVSVPLIIASDTSGSQVYLYKGQPVPEHIGKGEIDRLLNEDFIASDQPAKK